MYSIKLSEFLISFCFINVFNLFREFEFLILENISSKNIFDVSSNVMFFIPISLRDLYARLIISTSAKIESLPMISDPTCKNCLSGRSILPFFLVTSP